MRIITLLLLSCGLCGAFEILPPDFVSVSGKVCLGWQGVTNSTIQLQVTGDLNAEWQTLQVTNTVHGSAFGSDGFQVPLSDLSGYGIYSTNITEEFHGYAWITGMDFQQHYVWVDTYAATNITFTSACFFRLAVGDQPENLHVLFASFTAGLMTVRFIFSAL